MEAVQTSETLVNLIQSTRRYIPEDSHLHAGKTDFNYLFICDLFNNTVISSDYILSNDKMIDVE
jgi:hypothetical protein